jgi:hypothetical protein
VVGDLKVQQVLLATKGTRASQVHLATKVSQVLLVIGATKELQVPLVTKVQKVQLVLLAIRETKEFKESLATKVLLV